MIETIREAGRYALSMQGHVKPKVKVVSDREKHKHDEKELFSAVDLEVQRRIIDKLVRTYGSEIGIIAEEESREFSSLRNFGKFTSGINAAIDPIDGTKNYLQGSKMWGISLGIMQGREPISGIIHYPALELTLETIAGDGTFINGERIKLGSSYKNGDFVRVSGSISDYERIRKLFPKDNIAPRSFVVTILSLLGREELKSQNYKAYFGGNIDVCDLGPSALAYKEAGGVVMDMNGRDGNPLAQTYNDGKTLRTKKEFVMAPNTESAIRIISKIRTERLRSQ